LDLAKAGEGGKDVPCNTHAYFDCLDGRLNMTVCCRSNDILWGAYGANAVHFSMLLEFMAAAVGIDVGVYRQFSNNYHLYTDVVPLNKMHTLAVDSEYHDLYAQKLRTYPLVSTDYKSWLRDLDSFMADPAGHSYFDPFFNEVALPMYLAWYARKEKLGDGLDWVARIKADDWSMACYRWIVRRKQPIKTVNQTV
ncbi:MAG: thymidylate synthase, partial [Candidatus Micrarchaeaceae archaeon]